MTKPTCGVLYMASVDEFCATEAERKAFAAGFVSGQAEKIYLGACPAAMFRPQPENFQWLFDAVQIIARRFDLAVKLLKYDQTDRREIWIHHRSFTGVALWCNYPVDCEAWHTLRAAACGIPFREVDREFHKRPGYNEPCDGGAVSAQ